MSDDTPSILKNPPEWLSSMAKGAPVFKPENAQLEMDRTLAAGRISELIDKSHRQDEPRKYLGASRWGHHCARALGFEYHQTPKDEGKGFPPRLLRVFDMGHDCESRVAEYLESAGFFVATRNEMGEQIGFEAAKTESGFARLQGHVDALIFDGPEIETGSFKVEYPMVWENKGLGDDSWKKVQSQGVKKAKPLYYTQMMVYCAYLKISSALFTALNRDTGELYVELVPFDARTAQDASDKALKVVESKSPWDLPRCTGTETDFKCQFCDWKQTCWNTKTADDVNQKPEEPVSFGGLGGKPVRRSPAWPTPASPSFDEALEEKRKFATISPYHSSGRIKTVQELEDELAELPKRVPKEEEGPSVEFAHFMQKKLEEERRKKVAKRMRHMEADDMREKLSWRKP